jgi:hypothetical protein
VRESHLEDARVLLGLGDAEEGVLPPLLGVPAGRAVLGPVRKQKLQPVRQVEGVFHHQDLQRTHRGTDQRHSLVLGVLRL